MRKTPLTLAILLCLAASVGCSEKGEDPAVHFTNGNYRKAAKLWKKMAEHGDPDAQHNLGVCYATGKGVRQDHAEAVKWFRKAAVQDVLAAQFSLGVAYEKGEGVLQDLPEALAWYRKAAEKGSADAQFNLGAYYENGKGVEMNPATAMDWYFKAGMGFMEKRERNKALTAFDRINKISPGHPLGERLRKAIYENKL